MLERISFDDVKDDVEQNYPTPLASVFRRYRLLDRQDLGGRHKGLFDVFEVFVRLTCVVQLQSARQAVNDLSSKLPQKEKDLEFLKRPSLGGWVSLLRGLSGLKEGSAESEWLTIIAKWYNAGKNEENRRALESLGEIEAIRFEKKTTAPHAEICNALVNYRNKQLAHAANLSKQELERRLPILEGVLAALIHSAAFFRDMNLFFTDRIEDAGGNKWIVHLNHLRGYSGEPGDVLCRPKLEKSEIYCTASLEQEIAARPLPLGPFVLWHYNEDRKQSESYFYNDAWRTKLEYLSFDSGSYYYHKELKEGFAELVSLDIRPGPEDDTMGHMSQTEREFKAEELIKRASIEEQEGHAEDALEMLELSAEYVRAPGTLFRMAMVQQELGDRVDSVKQTLFLCLQEDPENVEANRFLKALEIGDTGRAEPEAEAESKESVKQDDYPTSFHLISPLRAPKWGWTFWIGVVWAWIVCSAVVEYATGRVHDMVGLLLGAVTAAPFVFGSVFGRDRMIRLRLPLSMQLSSMRLNRFNFWFHERMRDTFGHIVLDSGGIRVRESVRQEKWYFLTWILHIIVFGGAAFVLTKSYALPPWIAAKRSVDFIAVYLLWFPGLRYVVMGTLFIYKYSQLSLKPMLTVINDDGMRALGPLMTYNLRLAVFFYALYWSGAALMANLDFKLDFVFLGLSSATFMVWSIGMPLMIRRAARVSKSKAVHAYSSHVELAFNAFLEEPDEARLGRYSWLQEHQKVISNIPTWPLSWEETVFVVAGSNLLLLVVDAWYVCYRLGTWPSVAQWFTGFF